MKRSTFILSVLALFLTQGLMQANMTNTIVFVNYTQPENSVISAYAISVMYLGMSLGAVFLGPLADRFEPRIVLSGSLLLTGVSCALLLLFTADATILLLMSALGLLGFGLGGNGTIFMKVFDEIHKDLPEKEFPKSSGTIQKSYCTATGKLAGSNCGSTKKGWYKITALPSVCNSCVYSPEEDLSGIIDSVGNAVGDAVGNVAGNLSDALNDILNNR